MIRLLSGGWPLFLAAIVGNAVVQAATVALSPTPSASVAFVGLAVVSVLSCGAALVLVIGQMRASASVGRRRRIHAIDAAATFAVVLAVALAGLASSWLVTPVAAVSLIVLGGVAVGRGSAGFVAFRQTPGRAVALTVVTLFVVGLMWLAALLLGFFITGWLAAGLTWLVFGLAGTALLAGWTSLAGRTAPRAE